MDVLQKRLLKYILAPIILENSKVLCELIRVNNNNNNKCDFLKRNNNNMYKFQQCWENNDGLNYFRKAKSEENFHSNSSILWDSQLIFEEKNWSADSRRLSMNPSTINFGSTGSRFSQNQFLRNQMQIQYEQRRFYAQNWQNNHYPPHHSKETCEILKVLSKRYWQNVGNYRNENCRTTFDFTVMSYNVLAQDLINQHPYLYQNHNRRDLQWELRWRNLFNEIRTMLPDILCLQEVQETHLKDYYKHLESLGYQGLYKKRTGIRCDGCAIYFKENRFNLIEYETVEFYQPHIPILNRDNIAIIAKLAPKQNPSKKFIVATTHLLYNPKRQDVRLAQSQLLLTEVERLSFYKDDQGKENYYPLIITGDFNSTPDSVIYELITKGSVKYSHLAQKKLHEPSSPRQGNILMPSDLGITDTCQHFSLLHKREKNQIPNRHEEVALIKLRNSDRSIRKISIELTQKPELFSSGSLKHWLHLKSVYKHGESNNPEGTTYQDEWITVDYIFYSDKNEENKLNLLSLYRIPLKNELESFTTPNQILGSDHLSLVAKFRLKF